MQRAYTCSELTYRTNCQVARRIYCHQRDAENSASHTVIITRTPCHNDGNSNNCKSWWKQTNPTSPSATSPSAITGTTSHPWRWWRWRWRRRWWWWRQTSSSSSSSSPPSSSTPGRNKRCLERQHANDLHWRKRHSQTLPPDLQLLQKHQSLQ